MDHMTVPFVNLPLRVRRVKPELIAAIERVLEHGGYILGPEVEEFEERFAHYCGTKYAVGVSDGTAALALALRALNVGPGDEVITAPNSFISSASCAALVGATPRFVDVRRSDMNLDPDLLEAAITPRTKAIIPVHLTGQPADMDPILEIAEHHGVPVIEDAAQSAGSTYHGRRTGSLGRAGCFSLHPLKVLHAIGDAGAVTTDDEEIYQWLRKARNHGLRNRDEVEFWSSNSRLDTLQAAILNVMLDHVDEWVAERRQVVAEYRAGLSDVVQVPDDLPGTFHTYQTCMIYAEQQAGLVQHLKEQGVDAKIHYPTPIHIQRAARSLNYTRDDFPVTKWLAEHTISLPVYGELTEDQRAAVINAVRSFYRR